MPLAHSKRILYVTNGKILSPRLLSRLGMEFDLVCTSKVTDGLELARAQQFDLFLFSDRLQYGSGVELCKQVREFDTQTPAIILLNGGRKGRAEKAREAQAQLVIALPFDPDDLRRAIRRLLASEGGKKKVAQAKSAGPSS
jgi:DNA-binding response OmpR family regulator